jgi:hypothetical protein
MPDTADARVELRSYFVPLPSRQRFGPHDGQLVARKFTDCDPLSVAERRLIETR